MLFCKKKIYPDFIIKPNADGSWYIVRGTWSGYGIYYASVNMERYKTLEEAEKAVTALQRPWKKIYETKSSKG